jgi:hypothetical protein
MSLYNAPNSGNPNFEQFYEKRREIPWLKIPMHLARKRMAKVRSLMNKEEEKRDQILAAEEINSKIGSKYLIGVSF